MSNWLNDYRADRRQIADRIREQGQKTTAERAGVNEMVISRYVRNRGTGSAADLYRLANSVGLTVVLVPKGAVVRVEGELFTR